MNISDDFIKAALLGTDKYLPEPIADLQSISNKINAKNADKQALFLKMAAATLLYETLGTLPPTQSVVLPECPEESKFYISPHNAQLIQSLLLSNDELLLQYALFQCNKARQIVPSELAPMMLNKALTQKKNAPLFVAVCGEVGRWLGSMNEHWRVLYAYEPTDETWETGDFASRKTYLTELRREQPQAALRLLQGSIAQENAANRAELLVLLHINLSLYDEPFLQSFLNDKSQKVKQIALQLLRQIEGSVVNQLYINYLKEAILIKEERSLLLLKKQVLIFNENITPSPELFTTGIEKVSSQKGVADVIFWAAQVLSFVHPGVLARQLNVSEEILLKLLLEHKECKVLLPFIIQSVILYQHRAWAQQLLALDEVLDMQLLEIVDSESLVKHIDKFITHNITNLLNYLITDDYRLIPLKIVEELLKYLEKNAYHIQQNIYARLALQFPNTILP
ncbi:MAG: DUF5691 domain-containing protein, partial [Saprospiraceae bacterium]